MIVNSNAMSLFTRRALAGVSGRIASPLEALSSGVRINSAKDDAAGLSISDRMQAQILGTDQARRNTNDGVSLAQTAEGGLTSSAEVLQRIRTLALQSANDTNSANDRAALQQEVDQLLAEFDRVASATEFNGQKVLDGSALTTQFQVGANRGEVIRLGVQSARASEMRSYVCSGDATLTSSMMAAQVATSDGSTAQRNRLQAQNISVTARGFVGKAVLQPGTSAKEVADRINASIPQRGLVFARAETYAVMSFSGTNSYALDFQLNGVSIQGYLSNASTDMDDLILNINNMSAATGVVASRQTLAAGSSGILLHAANGEDISLSQVTAGVGTGGAAGTVTVQGAFDNNGVIGSVGAAVGLTAGAQSSNGRNTTVGGRLLLSNDSAFTLTHSAAGSTGGLFASNSSSMVVCAKGGTLDAVDITTALGANRAIQVVDAALERVNLIRGHLGALQVRLGTTGEVLQGRHENLSASRSRIRDADFAEQSAVLARLQVLQQAGTAMLAQANSAPTRALELLR